MTVSFIIPNYNHARYVRFAIDSALAQTYADTEIIVVDDGSTDDSRSVLAEYGDHIRTIFQGNAGLSTARNTGIRAATGEYIALLDADDMLEAAYAERLLAALADLPQADGAYCGYRFVDQNNRPLARVETRVVEPSTLYSQLLRGNFWIPESLLIRRDCYLAHGKFDAALRACEDWDIWLRFSGHYYLTGIEDVLVRYRVVTGSMSSDPQRMLENRLSVLHKHVGGRPDQAGSSVAHGAYAYAYLRSAIEFFQVGEGESAYTCLVEAASLLPQLLVDHTTYYELACSSQERGSEGQVGRLAVTQQQELLLSLIGRLSSDAAVGANGPAMRAAWEAQALWASAQLHHRAGDRSAARAALLQSLRSDSSLLRNQDLMYLLARTLIPNRQMAQLKRLAGRG